MGTTDIEQTVFEFTQNDNIYWEKVSKSNIKHFLDHPQIIAGGFF